MARVAHSAPGSGRAYHAGGWTAVSVLGAALPLISLAYWATERRPARKDTAATDAPAVIR